MQLREHSKIDFCTASLTKFHIEMMLQETHPCKVRNLATSWTQGSTTISIITPDIIWL